MALYHTHRPQDFSAVIGQEHIVQTVQNQVKNDRVAHAYLFSGPRGVGKTTTARVLSKAVNCQKRKKSESDPCNNCDSCSAISEGRAIDVIEIDAASHTGVDSVRTNIIEQAQFHPTQAAHRVFIIDEVHMLSTSAFNALLKTLEEPPSHTIFILATTEPQKLPETILSRCQRFTFGRIADDVLKGHIGAVAKAEGVSVDDEVLSRIVVKSEGCVRDAMSLLDQVLTIGKKKITTQDADIILPSTNDDAVVALIDALVTSSSEKAFAAIDAAVQQGTDILHFTSRLIELLRGALVISQTSAESIPGLDVSDATSAALRSAASTLSTGRMLTLIDDALVRKVQIRNAPLPQLPLEMMVVGFISSSSKTQESAPQAQPEIEEEPEPAPKPTIEPTKAKEVAPEPVKAEEVAPETPTPAPKPDSKGPSTFKKEDVESVWPKLLQQIGSDQPSLTFLFNSAQIKSVDADTITLSVPYAFHKDKILDLKVRSVCEKICSELLTQACSFDVVVEAQAEEDSDIHELASLVGGEVLP